MTDPAVEAAQRAWTEENWLGVLEMSEGNLAIAAAREALKPIRELHVKSDMYHTPVCADGCTWPCDTAKLIYPEDELYETEGAT
jgi:hypothetical protein